MSGRSKEGLALGLAGLILLILGSVVMAGRERFETFQGAFRDFLDWSAWCKGWTFLGVGVALCLYGVVLAFKCPQKDEG